MRIAGITIPDQKKIEISLTYIYGVGRTNVYDILKKSKVEPTKKAGELTEPEINAIQKALEEIKIEGDLRGEVLGNIRRLRDINSYRGLRHARSLPSHGQRTRSNARTRRGKRVTIGAIKKEVAAKMEAAAKKK